MRYLELQAQNDQKNLNASLLYRIQGQPSVQQPTYQTLTEKLADQVKLRVTLRQELIKITDEAIQMRGKSPQPCMVPSSNT